jgi:hypothetical protein
MKSLKILWISMFLLFFACQQDSLTIGTIYDKPNIDQNSSFSNQYANSGFVIIDDVSRPWYFKMDWYNAASCTRIYYRVNENRPVFLAEFAGPKPPTPAPIKIPNLKKGDTIVFLIKTHYNGCEGPVYSVDPKYFKVKKMNNHLYHFQFEDVAGYDMLYNDGAFYFGQDIKPNKYVQIQHYKAYKTNDGIYLKGIINVNGTGYVKAIVEIRDNQWRVYKTIDLSFKANRSGIYPVHYTLKDSLPAPMYTSFLRVYFKGETDNRVRALKGCIDYPNEYCGSFQCCGEDYK